MDNWLYRISVILVVVGLLVSIYMTVYKLTDNDAMCLGSGDCSTVNASRYSEVYGIPVAVVGIAGYFAILLVHWYEQRDKFFEKNGPMLIFGMALTGFLFTLYLIYVEFAILKAICPFCLASQIAMTIIFIISVVRLVRQPQ
ncbi:MAG: vitamin K epoxide reductase family protein [Anaerolineales bacterium]|nr:vitamin K epoxide reductase family protein [Anaerolineales bacterium]